MKKVDKFPVYKILRKDPGGEWIEHRVVRWERDPREPDPKMYYYERAQEWYKYYVEAKKDQFRYTDSEFKIVKEEHKVVDTWSETEISSTEDNAILINESSKNKKNKNPPLKKKK